MYIEQWNWCQVAFLWVQDGGVKGGVHSILNNVTVSVALAMTDIHGTVHMEQARPHSLLYDHTEHTTIPFHVTTHIVWLHRNEADDFFIKKKSQNRGIKKPYWRS